MRNHVDGNFLNATFAVSLENRRIYFTEVCRLKVKSNCSQ